MTLNATTQTIAWVVIFFFASAGASAGYLTASEVFPLLSSTSIRAWRRLHSQRIRLDYRGLNRFHNF